MGISEIPLEERVENSLENETNPKATGTQRKQEKAEDENMNNLVTYAGIVTGKCTQVK